MSTATMSDAAYRRELGDGLVLRWATGADTDGITQLYSHVFRDSPDDPLNEPIATWARDMMSGHHPLITAGDFAVVEDPARQAIVAATCLLWQTWEYAGIAVPIGRPEVVASDPDYRQRGLVRAVFELIHARSAARGHLVQAITGIPYFYRQFGYEYALDLGGSRSVAFGSIPRLKEGETEPYTLRLATAADVPLLQRLYDRERASVLVSVRIEDDYLRYCLDRLAPPWHAHLVLNVSGQPTRYVLCGARP